MDLSGKAALFPQDKTAIDIVDAATGDLVQQHDVEGTIQVAYVQRNVAAVVVSNPQSGVHMMDLVSGEVLCKFILPNGEDARVTLSKDTLTLAVASDTGMF